MARWYSNDCPSVNPLNAPSASRRLNIVQVKDWLRRECSSQDERVGANIKLTKTIKALAFLVVIKVLVELLKILVRLALQFDHVAVSSFEVIGVLIERRLASTLSLREARYSVGIRLHP